jgi:phosphohistidine phosphatase
MLLFLVRHAHADPGDPDELRPLSARGREEARALAERLAASRTPPQIVLTSPLLRARETAEAIAAATGADLRIDHRLSPGATAALLQECTEGESRPTAAVCHQPDCSEIAAALTGSDPGFPPGGVAELELGGQTPGV